MYYNLCFVTELESIVGHEDRQLNSCSGSHTVGSTTQLSFAWESSTSGLEILCS
jgi:hypothetical protein